MFTKISMKLKAVIITILSWLGSRFWIMFHFVDPLKDPAKRSALLV